MKAFNAPLKMSKSNFPKKYRLLEKITYINIIAVWKFFPSICLPTYLFRPNRNAMNQIFLA